MPDKKPARRRGLRRARLNRKRSNGARNRSQGDGGKTSGTGEGADSSSTLDLHLSLIARKPINEPASTLIPHSAPAMAGSAGLPSNLDQFLNMDAFNDPQPVIAGEDDTAGMSFAEVFR